MVASQKLLPFFVRFKLAGSILPWLADWLAAVPAARRNLPSYSLAMHGTRTGRNHIASIVSWLVQLLYFFFCHGHASARPERNSFVGWLVCMSYLLLSNIDRNKRRRKKETKKWVQWFFSKIYMLCVYEITCSYIRTRERKKQRRFIHA